MASTPVQIVRASISRRNLTLMAEQTFGDMVKGVVDVSRNVLAIGGELHSDEEAVLLDDGSHQEDLWGINLYPAEAGADFIEFDSMINVRPARGNRSRSVDDPELRERIRGVVKALVVD
jgi:hypothetical protein